MQAEKPWTFRLNKEKEVISGSFTSVLGLTKEDIRPKMCKVVGTFLVGVLYHHNFTLRTRLLQYWGQDHIEYEIGM